MADTQADLVQNADTQQDAAPEGEVQPEQQAIPKQRFDEVYAQRKALEEENAKLRELAVKLADTQRAPAPPQEAPEAEPEFDDYTQKVMDAMLKKLQKQMAPSTQDARAAKELAEAAAFEAKFVQSGKVPNELAQKVEAVMNYWRQNSMPGSRQDALYMLLGREAWENGSKTSPTAQHARDAITESDGLPASPQPLLPRDIDKLPATKQLQHIEKALGDIQF